jgi:hypothetical protein
VSRLKIADVKSQCDSIQKKLKLTWVVVAILVVNELVGIVL